MKEQNIKTSAKEDSTIFVGFAHNYQKKDILKEERKTVGNPNFNSFNFF